MPAADSVLGATGNFLGGVLGQASGSEGDKVVPFGLPQSNLSLQAGLFDAGGRIGFADISSLRSAGPVQQLFARINALPISNRQKRRALKGLTTGGDLRRKETVQVMRMLGLTDEQVNQIFIDQRKFEEQLAELGDIGSIQPDVIRDRLAAAAGVSETAAGILDGRGSVLQDRFREGFIRDRFRSLDDQQETLLLQAQFGGFNPGLGLERIEELRSDTRFDAEIGSLEQALAAASGVNELLNPGTSSGLNAANSSVSANQGALQIAANQANIANQLTQQLEINNADSLAAGVAGGFDSLAGGFTGSTAPASDTGP